MKVRNVAWVITALLLVILSGISAAGDYVPPPGVLSLIKSILAGRLLPLFGRSACR